MMLLFKEFQTLLLLATIMAGGWLPVSARAPHVNLNKAIQKVNVTGTISSKEGELLPGASIQEKGTQIGGSSDASGKFSLQVEDNAILVVRMMGYIPIEVPVNGKSKVDIIMEADIASLDEVMVVGYGSKNKSNFTGSAVTLNSEDLNKASLSMANLLPGRAAGVR